MFIMHSIAAFENRLHFVTHCGVDILKHFNHENKLFTDCQTSNPSTLNRIFIVVRLLTPQLCHNIPLIVPSSSYRHFEAEPTCHTAQLLLLIMMKDIPPRASETEDLSRAPCHP